MIEGWLIYVHSYIFVYLHLQQCYDSDCYYDGFFFSSKKRNLILYETPVVDNKYMK